MITIPVSCLNLHIKSVFPSITEILGGKFKFRKVFRICIKPYVMLVKPYIFLTNALIRNEEPYSLSLLTTKLPGTLSSIE